MQLLSLFIMFKRTHICIPAYICIQYQTSHDSGNLNWEFGCLLHVWEQKVWIYHDAYWLIVFCVCYINLVLVK